MLFTRLDVDVVRREVDVVRRPYTARLYIFGGSSHRGCPNQTKSQQLTKKLSCLCRTTGSPDWSDKCVVSLSVCANTTSLRRGAKKKSMKLNIIAAKLLGSHNVSGDAFGVGHYFPKTSPP